jgi:hypothetical protein
MRMLVAAAIAAATSMNDASAADVRPSPPPPQSSSRDNGFWLGVGVTVIGLAITFQFSPDGPAGSTPPPSFSVGPPSQGTGGAGGAGGGGGGAGAGSTAGPGTLVPPPLRNGFNLPQGEYVLNEVIGKADARVLDEIAARHNLRLLETITVGLLGRTLYRWHIESGDSVPSIITSMSGDSRVAGLQANLIYRHAQAEQAPLNPDQYAPQKLNLPEAHRLASGNRILIAVIDSEVDTSHPDLAGAIAGSFEASSDREQPHLHGTGMAGAIAAHRNMMGAAPGVRLLTVRAFSSRGGSAEGTTFNIIKGLDWAAAQGARVVNMSFAGPPDPRLREALLKANQRGIVLVAAAGNAGPGSPPLFPAADPGVIAVTATNSDDALFSGANRGNYIAVAAPGVDILAPAPAGTYQFTTGTSIAAAEVSGIVALLLERNPSLTPAQVRKLLMDTAKDLGPKGRDRDFGAGLVNALKALTAVRPR